MGVHAAKHSETTSLSTGAEEQPLCAFILVDGLQRNSLIL